MLCSQQGSHVMQGSCHVIQQQALSNDGLPCKDAWLALWSAGQSQE